MDKGGKGEGEGEKAAAEAAMRREMEAFSRIRQQLEQVFGGEGEGGARGLLGQLQIKLDQRGLHLEIMDTPTASMFSLGSPRIKKEAEAELLTIAKIIVQLPNPVDIEGHTDSRPFKNKARRYDNWDLSIDRANSARRVLAEAGMRKWQINRVVGFADRRPKVAEDPMHPSNRRISISMRFTEQAAKALRETSAVETHSVRIRKAVPSVQPVQPAEELAKDAEGDTKNVETAQAPAVETAAPVESKEEEGLKMELRTSDPEGEAMAGPDDYESATSPLWQKKDRIFGGENPFLK
jgi:chemotaxis protein MotB